jgi:hypothetical protein
MEYNYDTNRVHVIVLVNIKEAATIRKLVIFITQKGASSTPMGVGAVVNISNFVQMTHFCDNHYYARSFVLKTSSVQMKIKLTYM